MSDHLSSISVVICAYTEKRWLDLLAAVASLHRQTRKPLEIIVVIDHNPALLVRARTRLTDVKVIENYEPRGLSGARNCGVATAQGEVIAFMDEDATAAPDWLEQLIAAYGDPHILGVGGSIEPVWSTRRPRWLPAEFDWVVGCTYRGMPESRQPVRNLIGCNMSFRREVLGTIAGFQSGIGRVGNQPVGCEETELCIRLKQQQPRGQLIYEPQARVFHRVPAERARWRYFFARCYYEGVSKASVAYQVGSSDSLSSEKTYTLHVLPQGMKRGLADALGHGDMSGLGRVIAITSGLMVTALGYGWGRLTQRIGKRPAHTMDNNPIENLS